MEIKTDEVIISDSMDSLVQEGETVGCKCGGMIKMTLHWDGATEYGYTFNCECGNVINMTIKRSKNDIWY